MFAQMTKVCFQGLALLVARGRGETVQSWEIGDALGISAAYVTKLFQPLCRKGWLRSQKGRSGGWQLVADPSKITLAQALDVLEPGEQWRRCVAGNNSCTDDTACLFHEAWQKTVKEFSVVLEKNTLDKLPQYLPPCFRVSETGS